MMTPLLRGMRARRLAQLLPFRRPSSTSTSKTTARLDRLLARLPKPLQPYTSRLRSAPLAHIISFLLLHEITAVVPLVGLAGAFHYGGYLPESWADASYVREGVDKFGRYFGGKGWFGFERQAGTADGDAGDSKGFQVDGNGEQILETEKGNVKATSAGMRILVEVATAYAITKVLLPVRVAFSVWATPWFARVVLGPASRVRGGGNGRV